MTPTTPDMSIRSSHNIGSEAELKALSESGIPGKLLEITVSVNTI